jgi:GNAT superfamily N-acetyltransferase
VKIEELTGLDGADLGPLTPDDHAELFILQRCCWLQEAMINETFAIPALHESFDDVKASADEWSVWRVRHGHRLVGAVRGRVVNGTDWEVGRLMAAPDYSGRGLGRFLLAHIEAQAPAAVRRFILYTGARSRRNIALYERAGYRLADQPEGPGYVPAAVFLVKDRPLDCSHGPA